MIHDCTAKGRCKTCQGKHHTSLCTTQDDQMATPYQRPLDKPTEDTHVKLIPGGNPPSGPVLLKTASAKLWHRGDAVTVNVLLDEGAQRSFITERTVKQLEIQRDHCASERVNLATFGQNNTQSKLIQVAEVKLETKSGEQLNLSALIVPNISSPVTNYIRPSVLKHNYLRHLPLAEHIDAEIFQIDLLIGADFYWAIVEDHTVRGPGPTAVASKLGYLLSGPTNLQNTYAMNTMICKVLVENDDADQKLSELWDLETIGVKDETNESCDYQRYREQSLKFEHGKYTANLPWKIDHDELPTNYYVCQKTTRAMVKGLTPEIRETYNNIISDQVARDFIEHVVVDDNTCGH